MKRLALTVLLGLLCVGSAKAEITAGDQLATGYLGLTFPLQESGIKEGSVELDWGDAGVGFGASYLYFVNDYLGIGGEMSGSAFGEAEYDYSAPGEHEKIKSSMSTFNLMAAGRLNVNPQNRVRFYFPFGLGLTSAKGKLDVSGHGPGYVYAGDIDGTTTGFGWFVGAGLEADLGQSNWILGGELRYTGFTFDKSEYDIEDLSGKENYSYLSVLFKVGYKF